MCRHDHLKPPHQSPHSGFLPFEHAAVSLNLDVKVTTRFDVTGLLGSDEGILFWDRPVLPHTSYLFGSAWGAAAGFKHSIIDGVCRSGVGLVSV